MKEKINLELYNGWVKGKIYKNVEESPRKYREFCAVVSFTPEKGEVKNYLPYGKGADIGFKATEINVGDILYIGYVNEYKRRTITREYCKVIEKTDESLVIVDGYKTYFTALEDNN